MSNDYRLECDIGTRLPISDEMMSSLTLQQKFADAIAKVIIDEQIALIGDFCIGFCGLIEKTKDVLPLKKDKFRVVLNKDSYSPQTRFDFINESEARVFFANSKFQKGRTGFGEYEGAALYKNGIEIDAWGYSDFIRYDPRYCD